MSDEAHLDFDGQNPEQTRANENAEWVLEGSDVVHMRLGTSSLSLADRIPVRSLNEQPQSFKPDFVYQHFGQEETIFGYKVFRP